MITSIQTRKIFFRFYFNFPVSTLFSLQQSEHKYFSSTKNKHRIASLFASPLGQYRIMLQ